MYQKELYHHGILGQRWGVRRFQNKDGSYTEAGKKRLEKSVDEANAYADREKHQVEVNRHYRTKKYREADLTKEERKARRKDLRKKYKQIQIDATKNGPEYTGKDVASVLLTGVESRDTQIKKVKAGNKAIDRAIKKYGSETTYDAIATHNEDIRNIALGYIAAASAIELGVFAYSQLKY